METSRQNILNAVRTNLPPQRIQHPGIPDFKWIGGPVKAAFIQRLEEAGGAAHDIATPAEAEAKLKALHPDAKVVCSAVPEIAGTRRIESVRTPHELADVDVAVVRAQFGIAEGGAVWITQEDFVVDALGFLSQHLVVLLDPDQIAADLHEGYRQVRLDKTAYGCLMMGPSATADVEATLVHGAQGPRTLNVFFLRGGEEDVGEARWRERG
jgi:L-lactate dehydrogenase complex protein LldG